MPFDPGPVHRAAPQVFLALADSEVERRLIQEWASGEAAEPGRLVHVARHSVSAIARALGATEDAVLTPVGVLWLPAPGAGARRGRWSGLIGSVTARRPGPREQRRIAGRDPERYQVVTGEPATLADLRRRHRQQSGDGADEEAFARYVRRAAVVTLERARRRIVGDRHKVPRLAAEQIGDSTAFRTALADLVERLGEPPQEIRRRADAALEELVAVQNPMATDVWSGVTRPLYAGTWTVEADESGLERLRGLNARHPLVFLPSHRSYADPFVLATVLAKHDFPRNHIMGGSNLDFWPLGPLARRAGIVFIRRSFGDDEVYKAVVQEYFAYLLSKRFNLEWYFEGGRSRTGKLRPPRFGLLSYVAGALQSGRVDDVRLVPVSITYERLPEVAAMAAEQTGAVKKKEGLTALAKYVRSQRTGAGTAHVRFGDSFLLRDRLAPEGASEGEQRIALQKVAFDVAVGINRTTPVTANALTTLALLGVRDEALTVEQVRRLLVPILDYIERRGIPSGGLAGLRDVTGVATVLSDLRRAGFVSAYDGGSEPVFWIAPGKHLDAAFYRNNAIHWFVNRAIVELSLLHAGRSATGELIAEGWAQARRLRDQLKFEFFFPDQDTFEKELTDELRLICPDWEARVTGPQDVEEVLRASGFLMAHRVLRSFLDAQLVVLEQLAALRPDGEPDDRGDKALLARCEAVGRQMLLQGRLHGPESLSRELFRTALKLADNYRLREPGDASVHERREETARYVRQIVDTVRTAERLDVSIRDRGQETMP